MSFSYSGDTGRHRTVPFRPCTLKSVATTALGSVRTPILHVPTRALLVCADCDDRRKSMTFLYGMLWGKEYFPNVIRSVMM